MLDAVRLDKCQLLLQSGDGLRAVGRVEHTARMRLERDQRRLSTLRPRRLDGLREHCRVTEVHAVEASDGHRDGADRARREPEMYPQLSTFSGTNVRRSGSVWPRATRRP